MYLFSIYMCLEVWTINENCVYDSLEFSSSAQSVLYRTLSNTDKCLLLTVQYCWNILFLTSKNLDVLWIYTLHHSKSCLADYNLWSAFSIWQCAVGIRLSIEFCSLYIDGKFSLNNTEDKRLCFPLIHESSHYALAEKILFRNFINRKSWCI